MELTPREIVERLDSYIIGQHEAKRAVAIALRNRYRRRQLTGEIRDEIIPKNILMIGPTGVGKTEIARRLALLAEAPFIKVEVTKFTEVGYVGRDVESMVRDLLETAIRMVKKERMAKVEPRAEEMVEDRLVDILLPLPNKKKKKNPFGALLESFANEEEGKEEEENDTYRRLKERRERLKERLAAGDLEDRMIEIDVQVQNKPMVEFFSGAGVEEMGINFQDLLGGMLPNRKKKRKVTIGEAREILKQEEAQKLIDMDEVSSEAIQRVEESGIIFLDELDKITGEQGKSGGPDVSREGVQRDILPIVEGSTVMTKHGPVSTDHILFISAGAFHVSKPSDMIPELQGRFPIRVELDSLNAEDFQRILTEPENALIKQYTALLEADGLQLSFESEAIGELAAIAARVNEQTENIGARRLHTIMEKLLEEISFNAPEMAQDQFVIDASYVKEQLMQVVEDQDLSKYIL